MGSNQDITERNPDELNVNRVGALKEVLVLVDRDKDGNEIILQHRYPGSSQTQYLLCSDERAKDDFLTLPRIMIRQSRRDLKVVRLVVSGEVT